MPENPVLLIPEATLKQFCCSYCENYLSSVPIWNLPNGKYICNQCYPTRAGTVMYRSLTLEAALKDVVFPCRFKKHECKNMLRFNDIGKHESVCVNRSITCPFNPPCNWEGPVLHINQHFMEEHQNLIYKQAAFRLDVKEEYQSVFLTFKDGIAFIVKYSYKPGTRNLYYNIRYFENASLIVHDIFYKVELINFTFVNLGFALTTKRCLQYNNDFIDVSSSLCLNNFMEVLDNPSCVIVNFNLKITLGSKGMIDYKLLDRIRCSKCQEYLVPPLFDIDYETVCYDCATHNPKSIPSTNTKMKELVAAANYPCRWHNCNFIGNCKNIKKHELCCKYILLKCMISQCKHYVKFTSYVKHLNNDHLVDLLISKEISYETTFAEDIAYGLIVTNVNGKSIIIGRKTTIEDKSRYHQVNIVSGEPHLNIVTAFNFTHQHCMSSSKTFKVEDSKCIKFTIEDLPSCFQLHDKLIVRMELHVGN